MPCYRGPAAVVNNVVVAAIEMWRRSKRSVNEEASVAQEKRFPFPGIVTSFRAPFMQVAAQETGKRAQGARVNNTHE